MIFLFSKQFWLKSSGCVLLTFLSSRREERNGSTGEIYVGGIKKKTPHSCDPASFPLKERSDESLGNRACVLTHGLNFGVTILP